MELDQLVQESFADVAVNKALSRRYGSRDRAIPDYVSDWLVTRYADDHGSCDEQRIGEFLARHLPDKKQKQAVLNEMREGGEVKILDAYTVRVDIAKNRLLLDAPLLDISNGGIEDEIVQEYPLLLHGNVWGSGTLISAPRVDEPNKHEVRMISFKPMQTSIVDLDYYIAQRRLYTLDQWRALLVGSMGYSPDFYSPRQQMHLMTRLCPLVQARTNLIELAPKGTGKSHVFSRLSRYALLISGGVVTRAQLFYNMASRSSGVITRYDAVILDEVQTIKLAEEGEILGALKGYLEQGDFHVMSFKGTADAGFVLLANIPITESSMPRDQGLFKGLPAWLSGPDAAALLDRFHGLLPGWELPKISRESLYEGYALKADYLGEVFHAFRARPEYSNYVLEHTQSDGSLRDIRAVERLATGFLKLLYPDLDSVTPEDFDAYCLAPARMLRQRVRNQLALVDREFDPGLATISAV